MNHRLLHVLTLFSILILTKSALGNIENEATIKTTSFQHEIHGKVIQHEAIIPATPHDVWTAFTTSEGLRSFVAPVVEIDFRIGGIWESSYNVNNPIGDSTNIQNEVIAFIPERMVAIRIKRTPPGFPNPEIASTLSTIIEFVPIDSIKTKVIVSMVGWKEKPEYEMVYQLFSRGNEYTLNSLLKRFTTGPLKWKSKDSTK